jgi:cytochrome c oxidase subunit 1
VPKREEEKGKRREEREADAPAGLLDEQGIRELEETWREPSPLKSWFTNTDHKAIGKRYIVTAFVFFLLGGLEAAAMRLQLMRPENNLIGPDLYNQIFTMHGSTMMFLFAVPVMEGVGIYLVPLMVGTRNVAFPRMNAFGYYMYLAGGILLYTAFFFNTGPDAGWFAYVPLSGPQFSPGKRIDTWAQMISFTEIAALVGAVEIITTVFKQRAPGMSLNRIPVYVWALVVTSFMVIFAMPAVMLASSMLATDRMTHVSTHFFNPAEGGDAILWQHLFWFFGHPEVYIIFIPATGFVSAIITAFARRPIFGYMAVILSLISTGFIGFGLWVHHMFATPLPQLGQSFYTGASMMIAIPSGVQMFCWIATLWGGRLNLKTPLYFVLGFIATFAIGGLSGVMLASVPLDTQMHDTYFVVAHFHYVLIGGAVFPLFGAFYYWMPKWTGRMMSEGLGKINFWLLFIGFNLTFFPMHRLGLSGMPRRVYTYLPNMGWDDMNLAATVGAGIIGLSVVCFIFNFFWSRAAGRVAGADPWGAESLEWATASPPPPYGFAHIPVVEGRSPLWERSVDAPVVVGLSTKKRMVLGTTIADAAPEHRYELPGPSVWPFILALAVSSFWVGIVFTPYALYYGSVLTLLALFGWFWSDPQRGGLRDKPLKVDEWRRAEDTGELPAEAKA